MDEARFPSAPPPAPGEQAIFYIAATSSLAERRPRTLKHGNTFGLFDNYGDITPGPDSPEGIFHEDTRFLSCLRVLIDGHRPLLLSSTIQDNNAVLTVDLTNPDLFDGADLRLPKDTIHILRSRFLWEAQCFDRLRIQNFGDRRHRVTISFEYCADFADLFEVRGQKRARRGALEAEIEPPSTAAFRYRALDGLAHWTRLRFEPAPTRLEINRADFELDLAPGAQRTLFVTCRCDKDVQGSWSGGFLSSFRKARRALRVATSRTASIATSNEVFNEVLCRSMADLYMLMTDTDMGPYPYAGVPWYSTAFGRDGIITAIEMLWIDPHIARGVLRFLARHQATAFDPVSDAEPGKILHETRLGEMARLGEVPFRKYYGSVDATPLFVLLAGLYYERTGDLDTIRDLWPHIKNALSWIDTCGDIDGDGFIEYQRKAASGLVHQGWKDSHDSVFHRDGTGAEPPIALCEVQGYVYAAKRHAAELARALGLPTEAVALDLEAEQLRQKVESDFWIEEMGFYAMALDRDKRPCRVRTSNPGHLLFCRLPEEARARRVADVLASRDCFSGWGVRTVAASERRYNPMSYHNGSIWPHDNALLALGLSHYGLTSHVLQLFKGMFDAMSYMDLRRLPELFCGFTRQSGKGPTAYPVACAPQAWASAAPFAFLQACLGLRFDARNRAIGFHQPALPPFLDELVIQSLSLGGAGADILLRRHDNDVSVNVIRRTGEITVRVALS